MSAVIDKDDKVWNIFLEYTKLLDAESNNAGLDIYGTEQRTTIALGLTKAHMTEHLVCKLKDLEKQQASQHRFERNTR